MEAKRSTKSSRGLDCKQITPFLRFFFFLPRSVSGENVDDPLAAAGLVPACRARVLGGRFCGGAGEIPSGEVVMLSMTNAFDDRFLNSNSSLLIFSLYLNALQRELYKSAARIVDSSSVAPRAPERKVRQSRRGVVLRKAKGEKTDLDLNSKQKRNIKPNRSRSPCSPRRWPWTPRPPGTAPSTRRWGPRSGLWRRGGFERCVGVERTGREARETSELPFSSFSVTATADSLFTLSPSGVPYLKHLVPSFALPEGLKKTL